VVRGLFFVLGCGRKIRGEKGVKNDVIF